MNYGKSCFKAVFVGFMLFLFLLAGCAEDETGLEIVNNDIPPIVVDPPLVDVPTEIESWNIGDADNLFYGNITTAPSSNQYQNSSASAIRKSPPEPDCSVNAVNESEALNPASFFDKEVIETIGA